MSAHMDILRTQLKAYGEAWQRQSARPMTCWELRLQLKLAFSLYDVVYAAVEHRDREAARGAAEVRDTYLRDVKDLYAPLRPLVRAEQRTARRPQGA